MTNYIASHPKTLTFIVTTVRASKPMQAEGVKDQDAEENIWTQEGRANRLLEKNT
jgi:hypothetical protein